MIENKRDSFELSDASLALLSAGLNAEQLSAVKETKNVVVSAGAGSGKTTVLASRYAYLVEAKNVPCEKILTLTFTKKAANEMKERIFKGLRSHLHGKDVKGKADLPADFEHLPQIKARAQAAIESFDKTHIQTLDSYFSEIAKKGARYYGINPNFTLDDDKITSTVNFKATKYVLEHLESEEIKEIAQVFQIQNVAEELFAHSILKFSTVLTPIDFEKSLELQKKQILSAYSEVTSQIADEINAFISLPRSPKATPTLQKLYKYIEEIGNPENPALSEEIFERDENAKSFLEKRFSVYCKSVSGYCGGDFSHVGDSSYKSFKKNLLALLEKLYLLSNSVAGFALQKKIFVHLARFQDDVNRSKRTGGILSFGDVSQLALASLSEHEEIRHIEQQKFDAIMIDEFQDDNNLQCDVLLILSDKHEKYDENKKYLVPRLSDSDVRDRLDTHKLFFVGDDKQSIYRFRGADVSVFRNLSASIQNSIELKTNYRSDPELIRAFNAIFGGYDYPSGEKVNGSLPAIFMTKEKFPPFTDGKERIPDFEADYKRVEVPDFKLKDCDFSKKKVTVALYPKNDEKDSSESMSQSPQNEGVGETEANSEAERKNYECEASYVAREIKKLLAETDADGNQKYHYKDIALLFRTATPTAAYENVLLAAGIPYSTEVYKGFFSDGPINDIISLLKLCVYPEDKNAYAKLLRSPFCSLTFAELEKVLVNTENPYKSPFDAHMLEAISADSDLTAKILNLKSMYDDINSRLKTEKLTKTISYIWYELGYRYETLWNKSVAMYSSFYDILFEMARLAEDKTQSLASFIDMVKSYEDSDQKLDGLDVVMDAEDAVQILTVHKSKGLEFKVVFVCAVSAPSRGGGDAVGFDKNFGFLLKTPSWRDYEKVAAALSANGKIRKENASKNYCMAEIKEENERHESAELRRLAYVAFTRAEEKLYIVGSECGEFNDEVEGIEKCRKFELHDEKTLGFEYTKTHKKEKGEVKALKTPSETFVEYAPPKIMYQLLLPLLFQYNAEEGVKHPAFDFVNDKESFAAISIEESEKCEKSDFIARLSDTEAVAVERETLSPKVYVSPSKLKNENRKMKDERADFGGDAAFAGAVPSNPDYELVNAIVASTVPSGSDEVPILEDKGEESENGKLKIENDGGGEFYNPMSESDVKLVSEASLPLAPANELSSATPSAGDAPATPPISPLFNFTHFGTIAHAYMEGKVLGEEPKVSGREWIGMNERFIPKVSMETWTGDTNREKKISKIRELCADMASRFENSTIYKEVCESSWKKTEYSFRSVIEKSFIGDEGETADYADELIVTGQIDLVYQNAPGAKYKYTVVDYKTNQKIEPSLYYAQLSCYRKAVSQMLGCDESEIRCVLYYLRFAAEVDITESC